METASNSDRNGRDTFGLQYLRLRQVAIFRRLVLLKFVNIGLTVLVTNSRRVIDLLRVNIDYEDDFTSDW